MAQCYMAGTVDGAPKKFITNVSVRMSVCFCNIMADLLKEANAGASATKGQAIDRRDELLAEMNGSTQPVPAATAVPETSSHGNSQGGEQVVN